MPIIESVMGIQVIGNNGENIIKSPIVEAYIGSSLLDSTEVASDAPTDISTKVEQLMAVKHSHSNKAVLDKFAETDGKPTYDGESLGSDFIIKMNVTSDDNGKYTVTSCDATVEQIDSAVAAEKRVVVIATDTDNNLSWDIPIVQGFNGSNYYFATFLLGQAILSFVEKVGENKARWQFMVGQIGADFIGYSNDALPNMSTVSEALDKLVLDSHTHSNKSVLDKFAETDGKPTYNGEALGGGSGDFIIKMTVESNGSELIVTSCDTTVEQIDEAVAAEKRVVLIASIDGTILELPMIQGEQGYSYYFGAFLSESVIFSTVYKTENTSSWAFSMIQIWAGAVEYSNDALPNVTDVESALNELVPKSHTHSNKLVLDKFAETDGKPTYNGETLGGGSGDFIIKMTVTSDDNGNYTVTSCDTTVKQIDSAVSAEKRVVVIATDTTSGGFWELPIVQAFQGETYIFMAYTFSGYVISTLYKSGENEIWEFVEGGISSESISYFNSAQPDVETVMAALNKLFTKSHTHANKDTLDKFAESDGQPTYDGKKISGASTAEEVEYTNAILPDASNVKSALDDTIDTQQTQSADIESLRSGVSVLIDAYETQGGDIASLKTQAHTHANKDTLDKLSDSNGKLQYNGSDVGLKPVKGTDYWTEVDKQEIIDDVLAALPKWTGGSY